jgi:hypothetical protein
MALGAGAVSGVVLTWRNLSLLGLAGRLLEHSGKGTLRCTLLESEVEAKPRPRFRFKRAGHKIPLPAKPSFMVNKVSERLRICKLIGKEVKEKEQKIGC